MQTHNHRRDLDEQWVPRYEGRKSKSQNLHRDFCSAGGYLAGGLSTSVNECTPTVCAPVSGEGGGGVVVVGNWTEVPYSPMIELEILSKTEILGFKQLSSQPPSNDEMMK